MSNKSAWEDLLDSEETSGNVEKFPQPSKEEVQTVAERAGFSSREATEKGKVGRPQKRTEKVSNIPFSPPSAKFKKALKTIAVQNDISMQGMFEEGLELWFKSKGLDFEELYK